MTSSPRELFVLMPFREEFDDVYMVICDAANAAQEHLGTAIHCFRADEIAKPGRITDHILDSIEKAHLLIADLSGNNPNVMYELGYGHALRKPAVMLNQEVKDSPFDVRDFRQIVYQRTRLVKDLRPSLLSALCDVFGQDQEGAPQKESPQSVMPSESTDRQVGGSLATLHPSTWLSAELQKFHLRLQFAHSKNDMEHARESARGLRALLSRITVATGADEQDMRNCAGTAGNAAVELELCELFDEAEDIYRKTIGLFPDHGGVHIQYADFLVDQNRPAEARQELARAKELGAEDHRIDRVETKLAVRSGDANADMAQKLRTRFLASPGDGHTAVSLLLFLDRTKAPLADFEEVCRAWGDAAPHESKWVAERALADHLASSGETDFRARAIEIYESLLRDVALDADDRHSTLHNVATLLSEVDKPRSRSRWIEAYRLRPDDPAVRAAFSQRLARWGELDMAMLVAEGRELPPDGS